MDMLQNYIKIAWRNLRKSRFYSFVNIFGLSAGIAFSLLVTGYIWQELQVDRQLKNAERQYIIQSRWKEATQGMEITSFGPMARALKEQYPQLVKNYFRWDGITSTISKGDKAFREEIIVGDTTLFNMYGFKLLHGDPKTALAGPNSLVITEEKALKYFGKTAVLGETLEVESFSGSRQPFTVTGIMKSPGRNSVTYVNGSIKHAVFVSVNNISYFNRDIENWQNQYILSYIELQPGVTPAQLDKPMRDLIRSHTDPRIAASVTPYIASLTDYYLDGNGGLIRKLLFALSGVAIFILFMALINFVNLAVSKAAGRMKEIGVRKVMGSLKKQLILQFLTESTITVAIATIIALGAYIGLRQFFGQMLGATLPMLWEFPLHFAAFPLVIIFVTGFIAGIYPAFMLSSLTSVNALKGRPGSVKEKIWARKGLITFQFFTAAVVLIGAIIISQQVNYLFSKDLGYNNEFVIAAQVPRNWTPEGVKKLEGIRNQLATLPEAEAVSLSYEIPDGNNSGASAVYKAGSDSMSAVATQIMYTDEKYDAVYKIPLVAGDFFMPTGATPDPLKVVINETQARLLGWTNPANAVRQPLRIPGAGSVFTVAGVIKDFHFGSMRQQIEPMLLMSVQLSTIYRYVNIRLKPGTPAGSIKAVQAKWAELMPGAPFEYSFIDDKVKELYVAETQLRRATYTATVLSLIIVLLGILGLVSLSVQKRTKEIGIRKVLGAPVAGIIALFMKDFILMIIIGGIAAVPVAYLLMQKWLGNYFYRVNITMQPFIGTILLLALLSMLLIILQTFKAAGANPVKSLRSE